MLRPAIALLRDAAPGRVVRAGHLHHQCAHRPSPETSSVPAGFRAGRPFSKVVHKRAPKHGKQSGRLVMKLKLNHAGTTALKQAPGGQLPVLGRVTITEPGGPQRVVDELVTLRRKSKGGRK